MGKKKQKQGPQPVHVEVENLLKSWNPPATDNAIEQLVGVPTDPSDVAATAHVRSDTLDHDRNPGLDSVDAAQMYADDGDDGSDAGNVNDYSGEEWTKTALQEEIDRRNESVDDEDNHISRSGNKDDLRDRLMEDDVNQSVEGVV